jgi:NADPH:quinone reductase
MQALLCTTHGEPEALVLGEVATPEPGPGQVRVRIAAAGVNYPDTLTIRDLYQFKPALPFPPGGEVSGIVDAVGDGVETPAVGARVIALLGSAGGFAEYAVVDAALVSPVPDGMPLDLAAGFVFAHGTSQHALVDRADPTPGETLLVLGAAGGVGLAAVEIGTILGLRVVAAASSAEKLEVCRARGAVETIDYTTENLRDRMRDFGGADIVFDPVGGDHAEPALRSLNWLGRYLVVGFPAGIPRIPLNLVLLKGCDVRGVFWGEFTRRQPVRHLVNLSRLAAWFADGLVRPHISARYPLAEGGRAIRDLMDRKAVGKVLVEVDPGLY